MMEHRTIPQPESLRRVAARRRRRRPPVLALCAAIIGSVAFTGAAQPAAAAVKPDPIGVIVRLTPGETIAAVNARHSTTTRQSLPALNAYLLTGAGRTTDQLVIELAADPGVAAADPNRTARTPEVAFNGRLYRWTSAPPGAAGVQWALTALKLPEAHTISTGAGTVVAVIDSGIDASHLLFAGALVPGYDYIDEDTTPADVGNGVDENLNGFTDEAVGHGTHVAGIVRMTAPGASIMPIRALDSDGNSDTFTIARAMLGAAERGADVVTLSLGQHGSSTLLKDAASRLWKSGVVVVGAAGNEGRVRDSFPAAAKCSLSVTSVGATNRLSGFASYGRSVEVAAPGEDIVSAFPSGTGYAGWSGTSMAAPFAAGEAALLIARRPDLDPGAIGRLIIGNTVAISGSTGDIGAGRIDPPRALRAAATATNNKACLQ